MKIAVCLNLMLAFVFFIQSSAWAYGAITPEYRAALGKFIDHYNSLTQQQKLDEFKQVMSDRPAADQPSVKKMMGSLAKFELPKAQLRGDDIVFNHNDKNYALTLNEGTTFTFKNKKIDLGPGKLAQAAQELEILLSESKTSLLDLFMSPAYAEDVYSIFFGLVSFICLLIAGAFASFPVAVSAAFLGAVSGLAAVGFAGYNMYETFNIKKYCNLAKKETTLAWVSKNTEEVKTALEKIRKAIVDIKAESSCKKPEKQKLCDEMKSCLEDMDQQISSHLGSLNDSARGEIKEIPVRSAPQKSPSSKAIAH